MPKEDEGQLGKRVGVILCVDVSIEVKRMKRAKKIAKPEEDGKAEGLWVDTTLLSRLHGRISGCDNPALDTESQRLLHYADVVLGTEKKEKFVSTKPTKDRAKR